MWLSFLSIILGQSKDPTTLETCQAFVIPRLDTTIKLHLYPFLAHYFFSF
jgi:hypothetical protein